MYQLNEITLDEAMPIFANGAIGDEVKKHEFGHAREKVDVTDHFKNGVWVFSVRATRYDARYYVVTYGPQRAQG